MSCVLVVDDQAAVLKLTRKILENSGFSVLEATNGQQALAILDQQHVDVLLTDMMMPEMSGTELIQEVWKRYPGLPVCCMTGYVADPDPVIDHIPLLPKPFGPRELIETLRKLIDPRSAAQSGASAIDLHREMREARDRWFDLMARVDEVAADVKLNASDSDGLLRLSQANRERAVAFADYMRAFQKYKRALNMPQVPGPDEPGDTEAGNSGNS